ncbi:MAG: hypothetical protein NXI29_07120 [bacterium]|nr:hypothetical protein [bacterium]
MKISIGIGRQLLCCLALFLFTVSLTGCGGPPSTPPPSDTEKSEMVQKSIDEFIASAKKQPKAAAQNLSILMESLESYATEFEGPYIEVRDEAKKLQELYQSSAAKDKIAAQLEVLKQKASSLSGGGAAE